MTERAAEVTASASHGIAAGRAPALGPFHEAPRSRVRARIRDARTMQDSLCEGRPASSRARRGGTLWHGATCSRARRHRASWLVCAGERSVEPRGRRAARAGPRLRGPACGARTFGAGGCRDRAQTVGLVDGKAEQPAVPVTELHASQVAPAISALASPVIERHFAGEPGAGLAATRHRYGLALRRSRVKGWDLVLATGPSRRDGIARATDRRANALVQKISSATRYAPTGRASGDHATSARTTNAWPCCRRIPPPMP